MNKPLVIILILNYNGINLLQECLTSYLNNDYHNFKVVVIDNGSTDGSYNYVKCNFPMVKIIRIEKNQGYSGGFNYGLNYAFNEEKADFVIITNNDVKADNSLISSLVEVAVTKKDAGFITGKVYYYDTPEILQSVGKSGDKKFWRGGHIGNSEKDIGQYDKVAEIDWCDDIYWLVSKDLYHKTGGYDTNFQFQAEDFDWQVRAKSIGYKIYYTSKAKLWHKDSKTIGRNSSFKIYYNYRNPLIVHMKYRVWKDYKYYLSRKFKSLFILTFKNIFKLRFLYIARAWLGFISAIRWKLNKPN